MQLFYVYSFLPRPERTSEVAGHSSTPSSNLRTVNAYRRNRQCRLFHREVERYAEAYWEENHAAVVAIQFLYYDFARIYKTLRVSRAMAAGLSDHVWNLEEIVLLA